MHPDVKFGEWQPIETAPRDGTAYLAYNVEGCFSVCHWNDMGWANSEACVFPMSDATHWMPLPEPPKAKSTQSTEE